LQYDRDLLGEYGTDSFRILGLERKGYWELDGIRFYGVVDRIDSFRDDEVRIVDYKTGKVTDKEIMITDDTAFDVVGKLFGEKNKDRPKIALQLFMYDKYMASETAGKRVLNAIYSTSRLFAGGVSSVPLSRKFSELCEKRLRETLAGMLDLSRPFRRTEEIATCDYCDFKMICGR